MRVNDENKNDKNEKMMDFDEKKFFPKKIDPLISKKLVPRHNIPQNEEKWRKQNPPPKSKNVGFWWKSFFSNKKVRPPDFKKMVPGPETIKNEEKWGKKF